MVESIRYTAKKIKEPTKKTGTSERSMIKYIRKCDWKQSRKQYEGGPNHEGYERNHYGRNAGTGWRNRCDTDAGWYALRRMPVFYRESLEEACMVHGLDADVVLANINKYLSSRNA